MSDNQKESQLGLEEIVKLAHKVGLDFVEAKQRAEHLSLLKASTRAKIMIRLEETHEGKITEAKLARLAESDLEYLEFLDQLAEAKRLADKLKVRYDSYKNLFEARRSMMSYQKAEMTLL